MKKTAIISAHIYLDDKKDKDIEFLSRVDNDTTCTGIFDDMADAILDEIEVDFSQTDDYYFTVIVIAEMVESYSWEGPEYEVEYEVIEIKNVDDLKRVQL